MGIDSVKRAVFLDRDGVLNRALVRDGKPVAPSTLNQLEILPDAPAAIARLKQAGFLLIVVTNQPDVSRGTQQRCMVEAIDAAVRSALPLLDDLFTCYHDDAVNCDCRKPKPGLLLQAAKKYTIDLPASFMVGDRWRDIDAGAAAGCKTILVDYGYGERGPAHPPNATVTSVSAAVDWILLQSQR